jgi:hypothetical protein
MVGSRNEPPLSANNETRQYANITHSPSPLFRLTKQRKRIMGNISDKILNTGSNALFFYQI